MKKLINIDTGILILRVSLGLVILAHSAYLKLVVFTLSGTADFFVSLGLPAVLAYVVFFTEVISGTALILGIKTRLFSALLIPILLGASWAHWSNGWLFTNAGGGWEYPLFLAAMALAQLNLGSGKYVFSKKLFEKQLGVMKHES